MEQNVKIKDYKRSFGSSPFVDYHNHLGEKAVFPNSEEERKMTERFTELHWQAHNVLYLKDHDDRMFALQQHNDKILEKQQLEREDTQEHRLNHLQGIKDNIKEARDRFARRTELERPGGIERQLGSKPLYKIVNDEKQQLEREDTQEHRLNHLQGIKDNIKEARDRFARRTELERPGGIERQLGSKPLYKIVNDGRPIKY